MLRGVTHRLAIAAGLAAMAACSRAPASSHPVAPPAPGLVVSDNAVGPLTAATPGTLQALRAALGASYVVIAKNVDNTLRYDVLRDGEKLLEVKPDDDGAIDRVRVISRRVAVSTRAWQVGERFAHPEVLTGCDCDDDVEDHAVCFAKGEHLAVGFAHACRHVGDPSALRALTGATIDRVVWSAKPWGIVDDADDPPDASP